MGENAMSVFCLHQRETTCMFIIYPQPVAAEKPFEVPILKEKNSQIFFFLHIKVCLQVCRSGSVSQRMQVLSRGSTV